MKLKRNASPKGEVQQDLENRGYEFRGNNPKTLLSIYPFITGVVIIDPKYVVEDESGVKNYPTYIHWRNEPAGKPKKVKPPKTNCSIKSTTPESSTQ